MLSLSKHGRATILPIPCFDKLSMTLGLLFGFLGFGLGSGLEFFDDAGVG